jgi:hypothetical protein
MPNPAAAGALNDAAILLFVIDGGCAVMAEARAILARHKQPAQATCHNAIERTRSRPRPLEYPLMARGDQQDATETGS